VELFSFREICQAASLSKFRKMKKAQTAQRTAVLDVFFIELRRMASAARQSVRLSKFRKMKKAQTAQRTAVLDVFFIELLIEATHPRSALPRHDN
jgi:hypothetical protein